MTNNTAALERGFKKAQEIINNKMIGILIFQADIIAMKAHDLYHSPRMAFTGNTWTGTAVGVYSNGKLIYYVTTKMIADMEDIVRSKLRAGQFAYLSPDYMGVNRGFEGIIDTDAGNSEQDAISFLESNIISSKYGITVVNGSEYANYIENSMGGDVITGTYHYVGRLRAVDLNIK